MRAPRGASLAEVLVATSLFVLVSLVAWAVFEMLQRSQMSNSAHVDARQQVRNLAAYLNEEIATSNHIYVSYQGIFAGRMYDTRFLGGVMSEAIVAIPEDNPMGPRAHEPGRNYRLVGIYTRPMAPADGRNPDVREVVVHTVPGQPCGGLPPYPNFPGDAPPEAALAGAASPDQSEKVFRAYLPPDVPPSRYFWLIRPVGGGGDSLEILTHFRYRPLQGPTAEERYQTQITLRNR